VSESALKEAVLAALKAMGVLAWSNAQGGRRKFKTGLGTGSADVIACVRMLMIHPAPAVEARTAMHLARFVAIELKVPGARPKAHEAKQAEWRAAVNRVGGYAVVARSVAEAVSAVQAAQRGEMAA
jgi:hypothetical protein